MGGKLLPSPDGAQRASRRSSPSLARPRGFLIARPLVAAFLLGLLAFGSFGVAHPDHVRAASAAAGQKVVIVVGPAGSSTREYIAQANVMANQARAEGMRVTKVYTPHATWPRVRTSAQHANLLVYFGHGTGFPSRYSRTLHEDWEDGFGLNRVDGGALTTDVKYWGAKFVRSAIHLAPHSVVVLYRLCFASGNAESDRDRPELPSRPADVKVAIQRVDNFASGFLAAGAGVVFAWGWPQKINLPHQLAATKRTMDMIFEDKANKTGSPNAFIGKQDYRVASRRTRGATLHLDPHAASGHLRAISGDLRMTAAQWRGEAAPRDTLPPVLSGVSAGIGSATLTGADGAVFSPNSDAIDDRLSVRYGMSEPGSLHIAIANTGGAVLDIDEAVAQGHGASTWDGNDGNGQRVPDGLYTLTLTPTDQAGNHGQPTPVSVWVITALSSPGSSADAIEVADADDLAGSLRFDALLTEPAAIAFTVVDASGHVVRHGFQDPAALPGEVFWNWDGLDDATTPVPVPDGDYRALISATTVDGTITYARPVYVGAFQVHLSATHLRRGDRVKVIVLDTEALSGPLRLTVRQRGLAPYTLPLTMVSANRYSVKLTIRTGGAKGLSTWTLAGTDAHGGIETLSFTEHIH